MYKINTQKHEWIEEQWSGEEVVEIDGEQKTVEEVFGIMEEYAKDLGYDENDYHNAKFYREQGNIQKALDKAANAIVNYSGKVSSKFRHVRGEDL